MIITPWNWLAARLKSIRNHGMDRGEMRMLGYNYKMPWNCAFQGWQMLRLHKPAIEAELGLYGPMDFPDIYSKVIYDHPYYRKLGITGDCPVAEEIVRKIKEGEI